MKQPRILAVGALLALSLAAPASAGQAKETSVTLSYAFGGGAFSGDVRSANKCTSGRRVTVIRRGDGPVGRDTSNRTGNYTVEGPFSAAAEYVARTPRIKRRGVVCAKGVSPAFSIQP